MPKPKYKILDVEQGTEAWYEERRGHITGSTINSIYSPKGFLKKDIVDLLDKYGVEYEKTKTGNATETIPELLKKTNKEIRYELFKESEKKIGFWRLLAERLFIPPEDEDPRDRGHRLEEAAVDRLNKEINRNFEQSVGFVKSTEIKNLGVSPDAVEFTKKEKMNIITSAAETKNYEDANHVQAVITGEVPKDLWPQIIQYFVVINTLEELYLVFHTDRTIHEKLQFFYIMIRRDSIVVKEMIKEYKEYEMNVLRLIDEYIDEYGF